MVKTVIKLNLKENPYEITVGKNILTKDNIKHYFKNREVLLIYDKNIHSKYIEKISRIIASNTKFKFISMKFLARERSKNQANLNKIHGKLIKEGFSRNCLLIGLGGGIVGDITGFAAATYQRGVDFILIPTSLLAQVDASIGGKTAINHSQGKNMIGAFHQPKAVFVDTLFLKTLPEKEMKCGLVEMIKHGLIVDEQYFNWINKNINKILRKEDKIIKSAIIKSIKIKAQIVSKDEKEAGLRALLNFGHTFGHAIEVIGNYKMYNHGEAVALGILAALELSKSVFQLKDKEINKVKDLFNISGINSRLKRSLKTKSLLLKMKSDKKKKGGQLNFIILKTIGKAEKVNNIPETIIKEVLQESLGTK